MAKGTPATVAQVSSLYNYGATATDPEGQPLTFSLAFGPAGMSISPSGVVSWTPTISQSPWRRSSRNGATWPAWNRSPTMCPRAVPLP